MRSFSQLRRELSSSSLFYLDSCERSVGAFALPLTRDAKNEDDRQWKRIDARSAEPSDDSLFQESQTTDKESLVSDDETSSPSKLVNGNTNQGTRVTSSSVAPSKSRRSRKSSWRDSLSFEAGDEADKGFHVAFEGESSMRASRAASHD